MDEGRQNPPIDCGNGSLVRSVYNEMNKGKIEPVPDIDCPDPPDYKYESRNIIFNELRIAKKQEEKQISTVKFIDEIKVDFIASVELRIICRFLGINDVNKIKNHPYQSVPLITLLLLQSLIDFMISQGYSYAGELNFSQDGSSIPVQKHVWRVGNEESSFTITGFLYFENEKKDNVVFFASSDLARGLSSLTCFTTSSTKSKTIINDLESYTKKNNFLRGKKIKDINVFSAVFSNIDTKPEYNWDNYYFSQDVKDLFDLEVFGFLKNIKKYNEYGISKRGVILEGPVGTGKTSLGYIICNNLPDNTIIWITPEILGENGHQAYSSIKILYKLADFVTPCVIFLEDLDLFSGNRDMIGGDKMSLGALMNILDGINTISNSITIGTTNRLDEIEKALKNRPGRFDRIVEISSLEKELRKKMIKNRLQSWKITDIIINNIVDRTDNWTGAEIQEFVNTLNLNFISSNKKVKKVTEDMVEKVIATMQSFGIVNKDKLFGFTPKSEK